MAHVHPLRAACDIVHPVSLVSPQCWHTPSPRHYLPNRIVLIAPKHGLLDYQRCRFISTLVRHGRRAGSPVAEPAGCCRGRIFSTLQPGITGAQFCSIFIVNDFFNPFRRTLLQIPGVKSAAASDSRRCTERKVNWG
ncbi:hypothetical protein J6590_006639 [Homalodisca vitripennis]|nr:hypothetical protein J6590_006639 [Homalodisca vitripennis]